MSVVDALLAALPHGVVVTDPEVLATLSVDRATWVAPGRAVAAVRARDTAQVRTTLRVATQHRTPVVPRGAGSGLSGGATAVDDCVVLSLEAMRRIVEINPAGMYAVAQPGVLNAELCAAADEAGLWYAPDPASREFSSIGGNIATNAGGLCCVKYGVTRNAVLGLEVVLADGSVLRTGGRTVKDVAGLDLTQLFVGSEGTLGVVTEATLRLMPRPPAAATLVAAFPTLAAAGRAVTSIVSSCRPSMLEVMDATTIAAIEKWRPMDLDLSAAALVLARSDAGGAAGIDEVAAMDGACRTAGANDIFTTADRAEGELLLEVRRLALPALEQLGEVLLDDVGVPLDRVGELIAAIGGIAASYDVVVGTFGHAGDGNLHPTIVVPRDSTDARGRAQRAFDDILDAALRLGGTVSGEHGIGALKRDVVRRQLDDVNARVQHSVKAALDPLGLLNPGKALPAWRQEGTMHGG